MTSYVKGLFLAKKNRFICPRIRIPNLPVSLTGTIVCYRSGIKIPLFEEFNLYNLDLVIVVKRNDQGFATLIKIRMRDGVVNSSSIDRSRFEHLTIDRPETIKAIGCLNVNAKCI
jgi:hypothetical protein